MAMPWKHTAVHYSKDDGTVIVIALMNKLDMKGLKKYVRAEKGEKNDRLVGQG